ncbi:MAG TPA: putative lipid II flippase FtsW [Propionibacteriaceae bacterium]|nr:putative lipid II flippase FtsW [Propionibacteriaceae bacterium]
MTTATRSRQPAPRTRAGVLAEALARPLADYYLVLIPTVLLLGVGQLMVLSSSSLYSQSLGQGPYAIAIKQAIFLLAGVPLAWWLSTRTERSLKSLSWLAIGLSLLLLLLVLSPLGVAVKGHQGWLKLGPLQLQPSEFAKLALTMFLAQVASAKQRMLDQPRELAPLFLGFGLVMGLVLLEKDLGTAIVIAAIFFAVLWTIGIQGRVLLLLVAAAGLGLASMVILSPNRMTRIFSFLGQSNDPAASQQPESSIYAIATGGWWGLGLGASRQKWGALADGAQNDFVFAVLGEELGLVGVLAVLALFATLAWAGFRIALRVDSMYLRVLAGGCTSWLLFQALVNVGMAMRMLPVVGVPLPFISAGGSALMSTMMAVGLLLAAARAEPAARRALDQRKGIRPPRVTTVVDGR